MAEDDPSKHFFKFIPPAFLFNLSIPKSFMAKLNEWRGKKKAILRRGSHKWAVDINSEGGVLGEGWRKFVRDNGVQELDFIVFKHLGNMVFEFHVFDQSTCERHYYYPPEDLVDDDIDVKDQSFTEASADSLHTHRHTERSLMIVIENINSRKYRHSLWNNLFPFLLWNHVLYLHRQKEVITSINEWLKMVNHKATKKTKNHRSEIKDGDDSSFVTTMTPYCIKEARLRVPVQFGRSNGLFAKRGHIQTVIVDEAQRTWPATLRIESSDKIRLTGWRKLISKNRLKVGDACKFELVKSGEITLFNFNNLRDKLTNNRRQIKKERGLTKKKTSSTRYFISTLKKKYMYLPKGFATSNGLFCKEQMIVKNIDESSWVMKITNIKNRYCYIKQGWKAFFAANKLKEGVRFKLELVSNDEKPVAYFTL